MCKRILEALYLRTKNNLVDYDILTGVYSRKYYSRYLKNKYKDKEFVLILLDLNKLKQVNDVHGHIAGDNFLIDVATNLEKFGITCRLGGDEFLLFISEDVLDAFKEYADNNHDFCYAYMKKNKENSIDEVMAVIDKDLVIAKNNYRKAHPRKEGRVES